MKKLTIKNPFKNDVFLNGYAIWFSGSMIVAVLNYIFHPILGRLMDPIAFGDVQALISLIAQVGILFGAFSVVAVNITTNFDNHEDRDAMIAELQRISFYIVGFGIVVILLWISELKSFFNFSSVYPFIGLAIMLPISSAATFRSAYLHGSGRFKDLSVSGVVSSITRLLFAVSLVILGLGSLGATIGIVLAVITSYFYLFWRTKNDLHLKIKNNFHLLEKGSIRKEIVYGVLVLFATTLVTLFFTIDVLVVKYFFSAYEAGLYSGISAVAKVIFFAIVPVSGVLFSSIKLQNTQKENMIILSKSLVISILVGLVGLLTFYLFHDMTIKVLIGQKYLSLSYLLPKVGLIMFLSAVLNVLVFYFLALRRFFLIPVSILGIGVMWLLIINNHSDLNSILNNMLFGLVSIISILIIVYAKDYFNRSSSI